LFPPLYFRMRFSASARTLVLSGALLLSACSGDKPGPVTPPPPQENVAWLDVAAGARHTCAVDDQNRAHCWGTNHVGQLGSATTAALTPPKLVDGGHSFRVIAAGVDHTCAITTQGGQVYCWGLNNTYQLGDGTATSRGAPVQVPGISGIRSLTLGIANSYALAEDGTLYCWGFGCPGMPYDRYAAQPMTVTALPQLSSLEHGGTHTCGVAAGRTLCWGEGLHQSLGPLPSDFDQWSDHNVVLPEIAFSAVAAGNNHTCGLSTAGSAYCWGDNRHGQVGLGVFEPNMGFKDGRAPGPAVIGGRTFTRIFSGGLATCGMTASGTAYCWGDNSSGQLGDGTTQDRAEPAPISGGHTWATLSLGAFSSDSPGHTCGITTTGRLYCWGSGAFGGAPTASTSPVAVNVVR
jgi:alpha-tubulin suppressor-like RCC1 family protein